MDEPLDAEGVEFVRHIAATDPPGHRREYATAILTLVDAIAETQASLNDDD